MAILGDSYGSLIEQTRSLELVAVGLCRQLALGDLWRVADRVAREVSA